MYTSHTCRKENSNKIYFTETSQVLNYLFIGLSEFKICKLQSKSYW